MITGVTGVIGIVGMLVGACVNHLLALRSARAETVLLKRVSAIERLHALLCDTEVILGRLGSPGAGPEGTSELRRSLEESMDELRPVMLKTRIWLDECTSDAMDELWKDMKTAGYAADDYSTPASAKSVGSVEVLRTQEVARSSRKAMERLFRKLIGSK